jgi:hypothetical protein
MGYRKSSTTSRRVSSRRIGTIALVLALLSGCASHQPWGDLVDADQTLQLTGNYRDLVSRNRNCGSAYDGELVATLDTQVSSTSMQGYFQILYPGYLKFVVNNPFGQPLLAVSADGSHFQVLNTTDKTYSLVSHRSYGLRNDIPTSILKGSWFDWLTGRPLSRKVTILEIRNDTEARGLWYSIGTDGEEPQLLEHILLGTQDNLLLERVLVDQEENSLANISYLEWDESTGCLLPKSIAITGLSFGARADLLFSEVKRAELVPRQFKLPYPQGYVKKLMP